jgi:hypothetical protein
LNGICSFVEIFSNSVGCAIYDVNIIPCSAIESIVTRTTGQKVIAFISFQKIIAVTTKKGIVTIVSTPKDPC